MAAPPTPAPTGPSELEAAERLLFEEAARLKIEARAHRGAKTECSADGDKEVKALDERIVGMSATTAAGMAAQVTLLTTYGGSRGEGHMR
jgi:hypothetical protein